MAAWDRRRMRCKAPVPQAGGRVWWAVRITERRAASVEIFRVPSTGDFFLVSDDFRIAGRTFRGRIATVRLSTQLQRAVMGWERMGRLNIRRPERLFRSFAPKVCWQPDHASGTRTATCLPPSVPVTSKLPTGPGACHVPSICRLPPAVPDPLTPRSATNSPL